ncbi:MAG: hypothetical protein DRJ06_04645 [Candidatus Aminicenantes bacterium]|nr:MAG: hypothetical protein DRJ06_04645 [Candidatus Aminicenantes bacterium]
MLPNPFASHFRCHSHLGLSCNKLWLLGQTKLSKSYFTINEPFLYHWERRGGDIISPSFGHQFFVPSCFRAELH